jgi:hypothetical protein
MSARDEALRLWKEVGGKAFDNEMFTEMDINDLMGLIALARQRQNRCVLCGRGSDSYNLYCVPCIQSSVTHALAAAPKPGEGA